MALNQFTSLVPISFYEPKIIKSGIRPFSKGKIYLDTSATEGVNNISDGEIITYDKRPSRANMPPIANSVWFAKMKGSNKIIIVSEKDDDLINESVFSTGFLGIESSIRLPLSLLTAILISDDFHIKRDLNSVGTTMAGVNNETFKRITVPYLHDEEIKSFDYRHKDLINKLCIIRRQISCLRKAKANLLKKYF